MALALSTNGEAIRDTFRTWHAERDAIDNELSESLSALASFQSHLDEWQQQLVRERDELQAASELFDRRRSEVGATCDEVARARESLYEAEVEIERERKRLNAIQAKIDRDHDELQAARNQSELDRDLVSASRAELERDQKQLQVERFELEDSTGALETARLQFEQTRSESQPVFDQLERERTELRAAKDQLESDWTELRGARGQIEQERDELRAIRTQLELDRTAVDKGQFEASTTLMGELNASRDKVGALTTSLLSRTEELRTLDNRRAEVVTELELSRARERELATALDEYKRTAEQERTQWKEELKHLRELLERRVEPIALEERIVPATEQAAAPIHTAPLSVVTQVSARENPVLGSIVEQFDKLRQQRANVRQSATKTR